MKKRASTKTGKAKRRGKAPDLTVSRKGSSVRGGVTTLAGRQAAPPVGLAALPIDTYSPSDFLLA
jgi:hypothetical protein